MKETGEWGEFFPIKYSPHAYNESLAQEFFPIDQQIAEKQNWPWKELEQKELEVDTDYKIPERIGDVTDEILSKRLICSNSQKAYKINSQELAFYKKMNLPIPKNCFESRHLKRLARCNPRQLFSRQCHKTSQKITTSVEPDRNIRVYGREAYLAEFT